MRVGQRCCLQVCLLVLTCTHAQQNAPFHPYGSRGERSSIEFVGDSIMLGVDLGADGQADDSESAFPLLLKKALGATVRITARRGITAGEMAGRYMPPSGAQGGEFSPDWIFVNLGANHRHHSDRDYQDQMLQLLEVLRHEWPNTRLVVLNFFIMTPERRPVLKQLQEERFDLGIHVWDVQPTLIGFVDEGVHPDKQSHQRLSHYLMEKMRREVMGSRLPPHRQIQPGQHMQ